MSYLLTDNRVEHAATIIGGLFSIIVCRSDLTCDVILCWISFPYISLSQAVAEIMQHWMCRKGLKILTLHTYASVRDWK